MNRKRVVLATCSLAFCLALSACGNTTASTGKSSGDVSNASSAPSSGAVESANANTFVGTWDLISLKSGGTAYSQQDIEQTRSNGKDSFMVLSPDGTAIIVIAGSRGDDPTWKAESDGSVMLTFSGGDNMKLVPEGSQLVAGNANEYMRFEKGAERSSIPEKKATSSSSSAATQSSSATAKSPSSKSAKFEANVDDVSVGEDYQGNPALIVTYSWKNNSDKSRSFASALHPRCYQNGVQLSTAIVLSGIDSEGYLADVKPGYGTTAQLAYELKDTENPVEIEVYELASFKGDPLASTTYKF